MAGKRSASTTPQSHHTSNLQRTPSKQKPISLMNRLMAPTSTLGGVLQPSQQPSSLPSSSSSDHPVEVIGRIREHPEGPNKPSSLKVLQNGSSVRVRTDQGYRDFALDGMSLAEDEDIQSFYKKYVESRIESVKAGGRCTVMMYGPTGAGKSHTMFGSAKEPGIAYRALQNILGESCGSPEKKKMKSNTGSPEGSGKKLRVIARVLEIYNEDIFDLLATTCPNTHSGPWMKPRARLEIMGKKVKNAVSISGTDADQIAKEIVKVEKRRVVKSTLCNERSSRSHCLVMLDVPSIGGRLVLVDMAGSENLDQAGMGTDLKMQTGKINQGNVALKRVVEAIANGDSYIPFRDSKLTMLLQDAFEDDEAKILMILCASPDPRDMHKTIGTLEYGCKAKCIVHLHISPAKEKASAHDRAESAAVLEARIQAMEIYISKLEAESRSKEKEKEELVKELREMSARREESGDRCSRCCGDDLRLQIESRISERQMAAEEFIRSERRKLEEKEKDLDTMCEQMRSRMIELENEMEILMGRIYASSEAVERVKHDADHYEVSGRRANVFDDSSGSPVEANEEGERTSEEMASSSIPCVGNVSAASIAGIISPLQSGESIDSLLSSCLVSPSVVEHQQHEAGYGWMPAIPEEPEKEETELTANDLGNNNVAPLHIASFAPPLKEVGTPLQTNMAIEAAGADCISADGKLPPEERNRRSFASRSDCDREQRRLDGDDEAALVAASRRTRIENIFLLCGNRRELAAQGQRNEPMQGGTPVLNKHVEEEVPGDRQILPGKVGVKSMLDTSPARILLSETKQALTETAPFHEQGDRYSSPAPRNQNRRPDDDHAEEPLASAATPPPHGGPIEADGGSCEVYVKWETLKDSGGGKWIDTVRIKRDATLAELRREVEQRVPEEDDDEEAKRDFVFLMLGDPTGSPVEREDEMQLLVRSLPDCQRRRGSKLACLRLRVPSQNSALICSKENLMNWNSRNAAPACILKPNDPNVAAADSGQKPGAAQRHVLASVSPSSVGLLRT